MTGGYSLRPKLAKELEEGAAEAQMKYFEDNIDRYIDALEDTEVQTIREDFRSYTFMYNIIYREIDRLIKEETRKQVTIEEFMQNEIDKRIKNNK